MNDSQKTNLHMEMTNICINGKATLKTFEEFLEKGGDLHHYNNAMQHVVARHGSVDIMQYLIENGINITFHENETLMSAISAKKIDMVKFLIEKGADVHAQNGKAIVLAAYESSIEIIDFLIEKRADIHVLNDKPGKLAVLHNRLDIVQHLVLKYNVDPLNILKGNKSSENKNVINWCESYIKSKQIYDKLDNNLSQKENFKAKAKI